MPVTGRLASVRLNGTSNANANAITRERKCFRVYKNASNRLPRGRLFLLLPTDRPCATSKTTNPRNCKAQTKIAVNTGGSAEKSTTSERGKKHLHNNDKKAELKTTELRTEQKQHETKEFPFPSDCHLFLLLSVYRWCCCCR